MKTEISNVSRKLIALEIENRKQVATMFDGIREVFKKYDGKKITKRIENEMRKKVDDHLRVKIEYNSLSVDWYMENRMITEEGKSGYYYLKDTFIYAIHACCYSSYGDGICADGDVLIYEKLAPKIDRDEENFNNTIQMMIEQLNHIDELAEEYDKLKDQIEKFNSKIHWVTRTYTDIKHINFVS